MSAAEFMDDVEPRQLTRGDRAFLGFALFITLARVAGLLGAAFSFMFWAFSYAFDATPSVTQLVNIGWFLALYVASTTVMHFLSKRTYE